MKTKKQMGAWLWLTVAVALLACGAAGAEAPKMATVDMQKLFKEYHRTIDAQKRFNAEYARIQKGVNERGEAVKRIQRMLQTLSEEIKKGELPAEDLEAKKREGALLSQELRMMKNAMEQYATGEKKRVSKLKAASMQGIMKEIKQTVTEHAEEQGFDFVFDKSGKNTNQVSFFIYLRDAQDITASMLKELNKFAPGAGSN